MVPRAPHGGWRVPLDAWPPQLPARLRASAAHGRAAQTYDFEDCLTSYNLSGKEVGASGECLESVTLCVEKRENYLK